MQVLGRVLLIIVVALLTVASAVRMVGHDHHVERT